jgi:hypothetical protein
MVWHFHHVNAVDRDHEDGVIDLDIIAYPTAEVVQHFLPDVST